MRRIVKRLLKKHRYPPEGMEDAVKTVMSQCEMWADNVMENMVVAYPQLNEVHSSLMSQVAENGVPYGIK